MSLNIVLQIVHTTWTKKSRGSPNAKLRNAVPLAFSLDSSQLCLSERNFVYQVFYFGEMNNFSSPGRIVSRAEEFSGPFAYEWKSLLLQYNEEDLVVRWQSWLSGLPKMDFVWGNEERLERVLSVPVNEWVRLRWMGRFSGMDDGQWWYEHTVANIALLSSKVSPRLFLDTTPVSEFQRLPILR